MTLSDALDALAAAGASAGLEDDAVRDEGARLAAAVAESIPGAATGWLAAVGAPDATFGAFFAAASSARRWRSAPTDLLAGLVGTPARRGLRRRAGAGGLRRLRPGTRGDRRDRPRLGHRRGAASRCHGDASCEPGPAVRVRPAAGRLLGVRPLRTRAAAAARLVPCRTCRRSAGSGSGQACGQARREARQDPRGAPRRARRAGRARSGQGRDPPADPAPARRAAAHRGRAHGADPDAPPRLPRQPRHRQDHRRAAGGRHLPARSVCSRRGTWSRSTAPSWWPGTSGRRP